MQRRRNPPRLIPYVVFVAFVIVSGYALNQGGYTDSPFDEIAFLSSWSNGGEQQFAQEFGGSIDSTGALVLPDLSSNGVDLTTAGQGTGAGIDSANALVLPDLSSDGVDLTDETDDDFELPSLDELDNTASDVDTSFSQAGDFGTDGVDEQNQIVWSDVGGVLYDLWFICATTAVFIAVQQGLKFTIKQVKSHLPAAVAA